MSTAEGDLPHNEPFMCLSPRLAPTLNFPISCWRGALAHVPGREPGRRGDGSAQQRNGFSSGFRVDVAGEGTVRGVQRRGYPTDYAWMFG